MYNFTLERVKEQEFPHLKDVVYVDHAGSTLFSKSQMDAIHNDLTSNLYGNPHSQTYSSKLATDSIDQMRYRLLHFFGASPDEYSLIFTSGCTSALKLVADAFDFGRGESSGMFCFLQDNHTSVQGIRGQVTRRKVATVCLDGTEVEAALSKNEYWLKDRPLHCIQVSSSSSSLSSTTASLFAYPAQSNFSGKRYPSSWIKRVQENGLNLSNYLSDNVSTGSQWYVLLDAASLVSTSPLNLGDVKPDFVTLSFYKIFGYPTGLGALLVHRRAGPLLTKGYFGGGTVEASAAKVPFQMFRKSLHDRFEDGTLPFLSIISLRHGLDALHKLSGGIEAVSQHVFCVAKYFYDHLTHIQHGNGQSLAQVYGDPQFQNTEDQGGIVTFNLKRADGKFIGYAEVDKFAHLHDVHLRTGCFCNIGACQEYLDISSQMIQDNFSAGHVCGDNLDLIDGHPTGAVRISFGYMSTLEDAQACLRFIADTFLDISPMPSFPFPEWYQREIAKTMPEVEKKGCIYNDEDKDGVQSLIVRGEGGLTDTTKGDGGEHADKSHEMPHLLVEGVDLPQATQTASASSLNTSIIGAASSVARKVTDIFLYPVKSCGAFSVSEWEMGDKGLLFDREWVLVSDAGVTLGQKRESKICLISPSIDLGNRTLTLNFPGECPFVLSLDQEEEALAMANVCNNKVCGDRVTTFDCGDAVADWLSNALLRPGIRLLRQRSKDARISKQKDKSSGNAPFDQRLSLANESQILLLNRASVRALQDKMAAMGNVDEREDSKLTTAPVDISEDNMVLRFRGNLVIDGGDPFEEESWNSIQVGGNTVMCQNVCTRCSMICMDQAAGYRSREPLRTLAMWRGKKVPFGVHSRMLRPSDDKRLLIQVGQPIIVL